MNECRHLSVSIARSAGYAYEFLCEPVHFSRWASGLGSLRKVDGQWIAQTPRGPMPVRFSERNPFGVLDHWVTPPSGPAIYVPLRVVASGDGCELILTLFRQPGMDPAKFEADAGWVWRDLEAAKQLLEGT